MGNLNNDTVMKDSFKGTGMVNIVVTDKLTGEVVFSKLHHNLIVKKGRGALLKILSGAANLKVTKMAVGSGGTADLANNAFKPIAPQDSNTSLGALVYTTNITSSSVDETKTNPQIVFTALFDCSLVNSMVNECGLYFDDGTTLFARHTFETVSLRASSNFSMQITWTIEF